MLNPILGVNFSETQPSSNRGAFLTADQWHTRLSQSHHFDPEEHVGLSCGRCAPLTIGNLVYKYGLTMVYSRYIYSTVDWVYPLNLTMVINYYKYQKP